MDSWWGMGGDDVIFERPEFLDCTEDCRVRGWHSASGVLCAVFREVREVDSISSAPPTNRIPLSIRCVSCFRVALVVAARVSRSQGECGWNQELLHGYSDGLRICAEL